MDSTTPRLVVLGAVREQVEQASKQNSTTSASVSALISLDDSL